MADLVLWGAGGHGKVVLDVARTMRGFGTISFIDDAREESTHEFCGCQISRTLRYFQSLEAEGYPSYVVSIGCNQMRAECFHRALNHGLLPTTLIHPSAVISESARIADGTVVMPKAVINAGAKIGRNCIVNTAAVVEHDCRIGDHVHLSPGVLLGGGVTVHSFAHLGIGVIALPGVEIGERAIIGAGAVVINSVGSGVTALGIPAKPLARSGGLG